MSFCLGKRAASPPRAKHLLRYLGVSRAPVPVSYDWSDVVLAWGMLGNDTVGDCTIAAVGHAIDLWTAAAGKPRLMTAAEALSGYSAATGYLPADPATDQGADPQDILQWWCGHGFLAGAQNDNLAGFASITPTNKDEISRSIYELGGAYLGIELPAAIEAAFADPTQEWDLPAGQSLSGLWLPGSLGGHAILAVGYDSAGVIFISWGARYRMSWPFWLAYGSEAYALLSRDFANDNVPPEAWDALQADMAALRAAV